MIRKLSYCIESSFDPYHNLAVERFLAERAAGDECILYLWQNQKTVVIGYNQNVWKECRTAELAEAGERPEEILRILEERRSKVETSFILSTLRYMRMGGRCSTVAALGANLLKISPCIELRSGAMGVGKKYRGSFDKVLTQYVHDRLDGRTDIDYRRIFITDCMAGEEQRMAVRKLVQELAPFETVLNTRAGCTVSNHCGPGCLGILFFRK